MIGGYTVVQAVPGLNWLKRLLMYEVAFDPKNNRFVEITRAWEPPDPGHRAGQIGLVRLVYEDGAWHHCGHTQMWYVNADGKGFDGSIILMPVEVQSKGPKQGVPTKKYLNDEETLLNGSVKFCDNRLFFVPMPDGTRAYIHCELEPGHTGPHGCKMCDEKGDERKITWEATGRERSADVIMYHGGVYDGVELTRLKDEGETHWLGPHGYQIIGLDAYYVGDKK